MTTLRKFAPALVIAVLALMALWTNAGLPLGADVDVHYWRTFFMTQSWAQGDWLPRWVEPVYYGYGAPVFQYTAPAGYMLGALAGYMPFVDDVWRVKLLWALGVFLGAIGLYRYLVPRWGVWGGVVGTSAFLLSPYMMHYEPLQRASFPVVLAYGWLALCLSALDSHARQGRGAWLIVLTLPMLLLTHNLTAIFGVILLGGWLLWVSLFARPNFPYIRWTWLYVMSAGLIGAFFWLPLAFERGYIGLERLSAIPELNFRYHFLSLQTLLGMPPIHDTNLYVQLPRLGLGVPVWVLALAGVLTLAWRWRKTDKSRALEALYWLLVGAVALYFILPISSGAWERLPLLELFQFPSRFVGVATFALAMLAAIFAHALAQGRYRRYGLMVLVPLLFVMGWRTTPATWYADYNAQATTRAYFNYEIERGILGTTATNEFLPLTTGNIPAPTGFVMDSFQDEVRQRVNIYTLPEGVTVTPLASSPNAYHFNMQTPAPLRLEVLQTYFPLWQATLNGTPHPLEVSGTFGLTALDIPAGEHDVYLFYPLTTYQALGLLISVMALIVSIALIVGLPRAPAQRVPMPDTYTGQSRLLWLTLCLLPIVGLLTWREGLAWVTSAPDEALVASHALDATFDDTIHLFGYHVDLVEQGLPLRVGFFWRLAQSVGGDVHSFVHLVDAQGAIVAQHDKFNMTQFTSESAWTYDQYYWDYYRLPLPDALPVGQYRLRVGLWRCPVADAVPESCPDIRRLPITSNDQNGAFFYDLEMPVTLP